MTAVLDQAFRALSDPTRRHLVERLTGGPASIGELAAPLPMTLAGVMQHVQVLEASGLIRTHKSGRVRTCELETAALGDVEQWFSDRRTVWQHRLDRLGAVLDEEAR